MYKAVCKSDCLWKGRYWYVGESYQGKDKPPHHFKITEVPKESKAEDKKKDEAGK